MCYSLVLVWVSITSWGGTTWAVPAGVQYDPTAVGSCYILASSAQLVPGHNVILTRTKVAMHKVCATHQYCFSMTLWPGTRWAEQARLQYDPTAV